MSFTYVWKNEDGTISQGAKFTEMEKRGLYLRGITVYEISDADSIAEIVFNNLGKAVGLCIPTDLDELKEIELYWLLVKE